MYCTHCGHKNDDGAKFCTSCGFPLGPEAQAEQGTASGLSGAGAANPQAAGSAQAPTQQLQPDVRQPVPIPAPPQYAEQAARQPVTLASGKRKVWPFVVGGIAAVAVVGAITANAMGLLPWTSGQGTDGSTQVAGAAQSGVTISSNQGGASSSSSADTSSQAQMGNTASNYARGANVVSDGTYDYFYNYGDFSICRAKAGEANSIETIRKVPDADPDTTSVCYFSLASNKLFYVENSLIMYEGQQGSFTVHSMNTDGSDDQTIYSSGSGNDALCYGMYLSGNKLYLVVNQAPGNTYSVLSMSEDGSDVQTVGTLSDASKSVSDISPVDCRFSMADGKLFYLSGTNASCISSFDLATGNSQKIYTSRYTGIESSPIAEDGTLYFCDVSGSGNTRQLELMSIKEDGSDVQSLHTYTSVDQGGSTHLMAFANDTAYTQGSYDLGKMPATIYSLNDQKRTSFELPLEGEAFGIADCGDHLVLYTGGEAPGYDSFCSMDYGLNNTGTYVTYSN
ncbi:MAG: zinc-ribbon domain-containing protein [Atopobiaceae bacterium]